MLQSFGFDGYDQKVRVTPDKKAVSIFDLIVVATGDPNPRTTWKRIQESYPEVVARCYNFKFQGKGQRETPVANKEVVVEILLVLPGQKAAQFREGAAKILIRYLEGDLSLAEEIIERSPSENPDDFKRVAERAKARATNKSLNRTIKQHGGRRCYPIVAAINDSAATGTSNKKFKALRKVENVRDGMNLLELSLVSAAEELEEASIKRNDIQGDEQIVNVVKEVAHDIAALRRKYAGQ
jgi:hypothetical protein